MFQLGLELQPKDFALFLKRPKSIIVGLIGQLILLPAMGFLWGHIFGLNEVLFIGLLLITCSPGGSSSNVFSMLVKGDIALSVSLTALSSIITLFTIPVVMSFAVQYIGSSGYKTINLPVMPLIIQNIILMLIPILAGVIFRRYFPSKTAVIHKILGKIAFPALIVLISIFFIQHYQTIIQYIGKLGFCILILLFSALAGGWLLAWLCKLHEKEKRTIIIEVGMQNAAQAIAIATSPFIFNNETMAIPAIIYALLMNIVLLVYVRFKKNTP
jgi:BASS family bile acid:Na+ symporter